jgi:uncharacterized SAM-binding protein YcdF (DUF218 family)
VNLVPTRWYTSLFMPSIISIVLIAIGLWMVWQAMRPHPTRRSSHAGFIVCATGLVVAYAFSTPLVATLLAWSLERQTPSMPITALPSADAIVMLGGGQAVYVHPDGRLEQFGKSAGDRFEKAIDAFKAGKAPLLATGGGQIDVPGSPMNGAWLADVAVQRGVPRAAIVEGGPALYTSDECEGISAALKQRGVKSILLCTSAYHMPRSRMAYERAGFTVAPVPCDFDTRGVAERFSLTMLLPRGIALSQSEHCLKEWLGLLTYTTRMTN